MAGTPAHLRVFQPCSFAHLFPLLHLLPPKQGDASRGNQIHTKALAQKSRLHHRGQQRADDGGGAAPEAPGQGGAPVDGSPLQVLRQRGPGGGQEVQQIDPLGGLLGESGQKGQVEQQQRPPANAEGGQHAGGQPRQQI